MFWVRFESVHTEDVNFAFKDAWDKVFKSV